MLSTFPTQSSEIIHPCPLPSLPSPLPSFWYRGYRPPLPLTPPETESRWLPSFHLKYLHSRPSLRSRGKTERWRKKKGTHTRACVHT